MRKIIVLLVLLMPANALAGTLNVLFDWAGNSTTGVFRLHNKMNALVCETDDLAARAMQCEYTIAPGDNEFYMTMHNGFDESLPSEMVLVKPPKPGSPRGVGITYTE